MELDGNKENEFLRQRENSEAVMRAVGFAMGLFSKVILESTGCIVDYKINGELITDIEKLHGLDISEKLKLAIKEERYEDAAMLKKLLNKKK